MAPLVDIASRPIPRREIVTLLAYIETGSHKEAAYRLGVSESTSRQRMSLLLGRVGARNAAQAVWALRMELEAEASLTPSRFPPEVSATVARRADKNRSPRLPVDVCSPSEHAFGRALRTACGPR